MAKQRVLSLTDQEPLEELWERFPEAAREEVVTLYARLTARAAKTQTQCEPTEAVDDDTPR